ncbi:MAG: glycosyl transferase group 1 [Subtercola sp.]|nr:glycosyl transferase group 1 [Subtercola sp.]
MTAPAEVWRRLRRDGFRDLSRRAVRRLAERVDVASLEFPLLDDDIADSRLMPRPRATRRAASSAPVSVGWVCAPPARGSGGHTTLFRMVEWMAANGHSSTLFLYDRHGGDLTRHADVIRQSWPTLDVTIRDARDGISGVDAVVASSWQTAHVVAKRAAADIPRLYFVQDYEPLFYPRGSLFALAEDSYRFGFHTVALGTMVGGHLDTLGAPYDLAPFGCDTATYTLTNTSTRRRGVVFYCKPAVDRRGFELGKRALELFHAAHPDQPIHLYGTPSTGWSVPVIQHATLAPSELASLYNESIAGLALSFTNISLVAEELLACGATPVVNDSADARADLPGDGVKWALATPAALAEALGSAVESWGATAACFDADPGPIRGPRIRSTPPHSQGWQPAAEIMRTAILTATTGPDSRAAATHLYIKEQVS